MTSTMSIAIGLHLRSAVAWVGGIFFAHMVLRPAVIHALEPPLRLLLWRRIFAGFFPWVWISVIVLTVTGYWAVVADLGGLNQQSWHILLMQLIGIPMILVFLYIYFTPYQDLKTAVVKQDWSGGGKQLSTIRKLVGTNLILGIGLVIIGSAGRYI